MAAKRETARGPQTRTFNYYPQQGQFEWGGMLPDGSSGTLPPNRPRLLINALLHGGRFIPRGGQTPLGTIDAGACVTSLVDFQLTGRRTLYLVADGCPGVSSTVGFSILFFDHEQEPDLQAGVYYSASTAGVAIGTFGDKLYVAVDDAIKVLQLIETRFGESALAVGGTEQDVTLWTLASPLTQVRPILAFDGKLFFGCDGGAGTSLVLPFDGVTFGPDDLTGINPPYGMGLHRETLIMGFNGSTNAIRVRSAGAVPGTWATVAPGAGTVRFMGNGAGASYKDLFYIANQADDVYSFNGTALTRIVAATTGIAAGSLTKSCIVYQGVLYVLYQTAATGGSVRIASYDGTTWTAIAKDLTAQFGTSPDVDVARQLLLYREQLYALCVTQAPGSVGRLLRSPVGNPTGTWEDLGPTGATVPGDLDFALVY